MADLGVGRVLGDRYTLVEQRAAGATATVWLADDQFLGRQVAVKLLHGHLAGDAELRERFDAEARTAATVTHPSLVAVYDTIAEPPGMVLEWVEGRDLRQQLTEGPLGVAEVIEIGASVGRGLDALHRHGLVHRDVKPANVLLPLNGSAKLTDFGIATANAGDRTATGVVLGTAKYLAPEQVRGDTLDGRTDVYALCAVLYEALCGHPPFARDGDLPTALARLEEDPTPIGKRREGLSPALATTIMRGLERLPDRRWPNAVHLVQALESPERDQTKVIPLPPPPLPPSATRAAAAPAPVRPNKHTPRPIWPRAVGLLVLGAIAILGWLLISGATA